MILSVSVYVFLELTIPSSLSNKLQTIKVIDKFTSLGPESFHFTQRTYLLRQKQPQREETPSTVLLQTYKDYIVVLAYLITVTLPIVPSEPNGSPAQSKRGRVSTIQKLV